MGWMYLERLIEGREGGTWTDIEGTDVVLRHSRWYRVMML